MGWTSTHVNKGEAGKYFQDMLTYDNENVKGEFLKGAFVGWREYYAAWRITEKKTGKSFVTAFIAMIQWSNKSHYNFTYKDMDETCGPNICRCPKSIFELLSPVEETGNSEYAKHWREGVKNYHASQKLKGDSIRPGDIVRFTKPINFTNGAVADTFMFEGGNTFRDVNRDTLSLHYAGYRITGFKKLDKKVIAVNIKRHAQDVEWKKNRREMMKKEKEFRQKHELAA